MPATETATVLSTSTAIAAMGYCLKRTRGVWDKPSNATAPPGTVYDIAVSSRGHVFAACAGAVYGWDGTAWASVGAVTGGSTLAYCLAFDPSETILYVGGNGTSFGGTAAANIAKYTLPATGVSGGTWAALGTGLGGNCRALVVIPTTSGHTVYAFGEFTTAGGSSANYMATWNGAAWASVSPNTLNGAVWAAVKDAANNIYFGGAFTNAGVVSASAPTPTTAIVSGAGSFVYDPQRTGIIGPRFEHAVRNAMLTIMCEPGATFVEIVRIMTDPKYVQELLPKVKDPIIRRYWTDQIAQTSDFHKSEVLDYIVSKFGKFITNTMMRNIIGQSKSSFDFRKVMDEGKILLVNLSKGKMGEENSTFLGLLVVPKILAAAMSRVDVPQDKRREFFLYVDEFQNFATPDFATILSEARKYKLALTVANQFIGQMDEEVKNAVFGNVGTQMVLRTGVTDASFLQREFLPYFNETDIVNQERFHAYMKTIVNNEPVPPFSIDMTKDYAKHMADREAGEKIAQAIMQLSRLKYGRPKEIVEAEIVQRARL
jgi:hypothetical protein